jgi:hypothetical protein
VNWLVEGTLAIWMGGAVALTMALIVFVQTRTQGSMLGVLGVIAIVAVLLIASWLVVTPREAVEGSLYHLAATVEANDVQGAASYLASTADKEIREDIETLMPLVRIERARIIGTPEIEVEPGPNPVVATVKCRGVIMAVNKRDGMKGGAEDRVVMQWVRQGDRWLIESYASQKNWNQAVGRPKSIAKPATPSPKL